jgi:hypothetical protein
MSYAAGRAAPRCSHALLHQLLDVLVLAFLDLVHLCRPIDPRCGALARKLMRTSSFRRPSSSSLSSFIFFSYALCRSFACIAARLGPRRLAREIHSCRAAGQRQRDLERCSRYSVLLRLTTPVRRTQLPHTV